jgi:hypothetical protein
MFEPLSETCSCPVTNTTILWPVNDTVDLCVDHLLPMLFYISQQKAKLNIMYSWEFAKIMKIVATIFPFTIGIV